MPRLSTGSSLSRRPAVSTMCNGTPSICRVCPIVSRVVPAMGVTMASSAPAKALSSEDLPALGWPAITTFKPSRNNAPCRAWPCSNASCARRRASWPWASDRCKKSSSSSGKSSVASTSMRRCTSASRRRLTSVENAPLRLAAALRAAASVLASIKSATASACAKSILPFKKARSLNSPGRAIRKRGRISPCAPSVPATSNARASKRCNTTGPPWAWSSSTSSPVNEWGAGKYKAKPWSMGCSVASGKGR